MRKNIFPHIGFGVLTFVSLAVTPVFAALGGFNELDKVVIAVMSGGYGLMAVLITTLWVAWACEQSEQRRNQMKAHEMAKPEPEMADWEIELVSLQQYVPEQEELDRYEAQWELNA